MARNHLIGAKILSIEYDRETPAILWSALGCVSRDLNPFLEEINTEKRATINTYITQEAPQYRALSRYMGEFIDRIPPGANGLVLEMALYEKQRQLKKESQALIEEWETGALAGRIRIEAE